jgi:hypothetical protein
LPHCSRSDMNWPKNAIDRLLQLNDDIGLQIGHV